MPAPIMPAPSTPSFFTLDGGGTSLGRERPFLIALSWYHSVPIRLRDSGLIAQAAK